MKNAVHKAGNTGIRKDVARGSPLDERDRSTRKMYNVQCTPTVIISDGTSCTLHYSTKTQDGKILSVRDNCVTVRVGILPIYSPRAGYQAEPNVDVYE